jgi:hypothetical protein
MRGARGRVVNMPKHGSENDSLSTVGGRLNLVDVARWSGPSYVLLAMTISSRSPRPEDRSSQSP